MFLSPRRGQKYKRNVPLSVEGVLLYPCPHQGESVKGRKPLTVEPAVLPQCLAGSMQWGDSPSTLPVLVQVAAGDVEDERKAASPPPPHFVRRHQLGWARVRAPHPTNGAHWQSARPGPPPPQAEEENAKDHTHLFPWRASFVLFPYQAARPTEPLHLEVLLAEKLQNVQIYDIIIKERQRGAKITECVTVTLRLTAGWHFTSDPSSIQLESVSWPP